MPNDVFVEMECSQLIHDGEDVCGDDFLFERLEAENRHLAVLSDGLGAICCTLLYAWLRWRPRENRNHSEA